MTFDITTVVTVGLTALLTFMGTFILKPRSERETSFAADARERLRTMEEKLWGLQTKLSEAGITQAKLEDRVAVLEEDKRELRKENDTLRTERADLKAELAALKIPHP